MSIEDLPTQHAIRTLDRRLKHFVESSSPAVKQNKSIAIAFSGGFDSSALLFAASRCWPNRQLMAFHINHQLSSKSNEWEIFCLNQAKLLGIDFFSRRISIRDKNGKGLEASARIERYKALRELADIYYPACILFAHHADDQAETIMLRILRGTGIDGLTGMSSVFDNQKIIQNETKSRTTLFLRPWLNWRRKEIYQHVGNKIQWIDDQSNNDERFTRNKIRKLFSKQFEIFSPNYHASIIRLGRIANDVQKLTIFFADQDLENLRISLSDSTQKIEKISRNALLSLNKERIINILRRWIQLKEILPPSERKLNELIKYISSKKSSLIWHHEGKTLSINKNEIAWVTVKPRLAESSCNIKKKEPHHTQLINISSNEINEILQKGEIKFSLDDWPESAISLRHVDVATDQAVAISWLEGVRISVKHRFGGERMKNKIGGVRRSLKNLFQEYKVEAEQRNLPILFSKDRIIFVPFIGVDLEWAKMTRVYDESKKGLSYYVEIRFISL